MDRNLRECRPCTACCDGWLAITVEGYDSYPGHPCPHSTGSGCDDYVNRPIEPCVNFTCGWAMNNSPLPEWMKPSEAKVVVIPKKMRNNQSVLLATPLGVSFIRNRLWRMVVLPNDRTSGFMAPPNLSNKFSNGLKVGKCWHDPGISIEQPSMLSPVSQSRLSSIKLSTNPKPLHFTPCWKYITSMQKH